MVGDIPCREDRRIAGTCRPRRPGCRCRRRGRPPPPAPSPAGPRSPTTTRSAGKELPSESTTSALVPACPMAETPTPKRNRNALPLVHLSDLAGDGRGDHSPEGACGALDHGHVAPHAPGDRGDFKSDEARTHGNHAARLDEPLPDGVGMRGRPQDMDDGEVRPRDREPARAAPGRQDEPAIGEPRTVRQDHMPTAAIDRLDALSEPEVDGILGIERRRLDERALDAREAGEEGLLTAAAVHRARPAPRRSSRSVGPDPASATWRRPRLRPDPAPTMTTGSMLASANDRFSRGDRRRPSRLSPYPPDA